MRSAARQIGDIDVIYMDGKYDTGRQLQQAESLIVQGARALVLMAVDRFAAKPILKSAVAARVPLVTVNRQLAHQELAVAHVGSDDIEAGEIEMQAVARALGGKGTIALLEGTYGHEPQIRRKLGYGRVLARHPAMRVVAENTAGWYRNEALKLVETWLQARLKIDAVVAQNDEMALGALKAVEEAGLLDRIIVAGIDATPEALRHVRDGRLEITVFQDAKGQGRSAIQVAADVVRGRPVRREHLIPFELVVPGRVERYLERYR